MFEAESWANQSIVCANRFFFLEMYKRSQVSSVSSVYLKSLWCHFSVNPFTTVWKGLSRGRCERWTEQCCLCVCMSEFPCIGPVCLLFCVHVFMRLLVFLIIHLRVYGAQVFWWKRLVFFLYYWIFSLALIQDCLQTDLAKLCINLHKLACAYYSLFSIGLKKMATGFCVIFLLVVLHFTGA